MIDLMTIVFAEGDNPLFLLVGGPLAGVFFYGWVFRYYRNTNKSHSYEAETRIESRNIQARDSKVGTKNGQRNRYMSNANHTSHRERVQFGRAE